MSAGGATAEGGSRATICLRSAERGPQIRELWQRIGKDCGWEHPRAPALRWLWRDGAVGAMVEFLENTRVESRVSAEMARARIDEDREGDEVLGQESEEEGQARPRMYLSLSFPLVPSYYSFLKSGGLGRRRKGCSSITHSGWGQVMVMQWGCRNGCCPRGQRQAAAMALRAACSQIANTGHTHSRVTR